MNRRRFLQYLALSPAAVYGCSAARRDYYRQPEFGDVTILHMTDCHAQLLPVYYREPAVNLGIGAGKNAPPHLSGEQFLRRFGIRPHSREAYALTHLDFDNAAHRYGKMGGFAHLATLIKTIRALRGPDKTLLLDGGDSWQGSATALWTRGQDMVDACNLLGVDAMTGHWEFTYGKERLFENLKRFKGVFLAQNAAQAEEAVFEFGTDNDELFKPYLIKQFGKIRIAVIGQAYPYTPIANPPRFVKGWRFGIEERRLQSLVGRIRAAERPDAIILLSHNGMGVDLKLASRVAGIDLILGGHTHDAVPEPIPVANPQGRTWVTNAGSHGKFLAVIDLQAGGGRLQAIRYRLLPVFAELLEPDPEMQSLIDSLRMPYLPVLRQPLAEANELLYRRDNFYGTFDGLILDALLAEYGADIALTPGFRWGTAVLPGRTIAMEDVMNHTAVTYPETYAATMTGAQLKNMLEDVADNLFNPDPYYRQGGDMVRTGGMRFDCDPAAEGGKRIGAMRLQGGKPIEAGKRYKVAGWAAVSAPVAGRPVFEIVGEHLKASVRHRPGRAMSV
ncbi:MULTISPECIES: thiosulfohydrolase SoxB [Methylomicrobium]|uniref:5'-nucleotidase/2',3'-cyclic phosphodiesterase-like hydrolase n=1 Tax=Methylomicrobium album BG8 TaxID=686340 RepID=H8GMH1_METAL|nr:MULTISPECIES: thiosulfohydrolase SoxB [Methylomicrobium]EIC30695.1 5'-nucleotidase/2',3'-cyclic phosphodiesterase-like hydrolase [Methylomicrobium album BG8]